ncbi:hypothetical protein [Amycolatopsis eburnea]|uniref:hypothetical protein n=1 Tax=Amycolatopsis eburnea TaxID=2267691 RepID=UPI0013156953|nr:hypothetical protein [Amycolatopsis eburnea]
MTAPIPAQESVDAIVARRSGTFFASTAKPSLRCVFALRRFPGRDHATGTAAATSATAATSPAGPPSRPASPGPASAAAVKVRASNRLALGRPVPATAGS